MIEIMIVIAVIAIPMARCSRLSANEVGAIAILHQLDSADEVFKTGSGLDRYGTLSELGSAKPSYIDHNLADGRIPNYTVGLDTVGVECWSATAMPTAPGVSARRSFFINQTHAITYTYTADGTAPTAASLKLNHGKGGCSHGNRGTPPRKLGSSGKSSTP